MQLANRTMRLLHFTLTPIRTQCPHTYQVLYVQASRDELLLTSKKPQHPTTRQARIGPPLLSDHRIHRRVSPMPAARNVRVHARLV